MTAPLSFTFDIGHSSIGWAVLSGSEPQILGCGSLLFPKDSALASTRRACRRMRRNIRATRQRIERIRHLLRHLDVVPSETLNDPGHSSPYHLAAGALQSETPCLSWEEIWHLLRWYAHHRGYDGNARWAADSDLDSDDIKKVEAARDLMETHGTPTMAETMCSVLGVSPAAPFPGSQEPFRTLGVAFPRNVVVSELRGILETHRGHLPKLTDEVIDCLIGPSDSAWKSVSVSEIQLPKKYRGSLLFGQSVPRFNNRIIGKCPYYPEFNRPLKSSRAFRDFRCAEIIANLKADGRFLSSGDRQTLFDSFQRSGRLTPTELRQQVEELTGTTETNCKAYFETHPDSGDMLVVDPALAEATKAENTKPKVGTSALSWFWKHLAPATQNRAIGRWRKGRRVTLGWLRDDTSRSQHPTDELDSAITTVFEADQRKSRPSFPDRDALLAKPFSPKPASGRAPYSTRKMNEITEWILTHESHHREEGGPLFGDEQKGQLSDDFKIDEETNNHLVRHRLKLLSRLVEELVEEFAGDDRNRVTNVVVEVARDLRDYSGLNAKEISGELTKRLGHFKKAVKILEEANLEQAITGSLIRKCRIALDLDFTCPFTAQPYQAHELPGLELEHIIPYADRPTNALDGLVLTWPEVNKMKGKRTAAAFIDEFGGKPVDGMPHRSLQTPTNYKKFVEKLKVARAETYPDDARRQQSRKQWLMTSEYDKRAASFTQGALSQTSYLSRLAAKCLAQQLPAAGTPVTIPGQITALVRKSWDLTGTLSRACPEAEGKTKTEIRDITNLHHALDAVTLGLIDHFFPKSRPGDLRNQEGLLWQAMIKRRPTSEDLALLDATGLFARHSNDGKWETKLQDLSAPLKDSIGRSLMEKRVAQHIPADQSGAALELNPWRVISFEGDSEDPATVVHLQQTSTETKAGRRVRKRKKAKEKAGKLVGLKPGKLKQNQSVLVIKDNFGMALDPDPQIIPFHDVPKRLKDIADRNHGRKPRILRPGMIIKIRGIPGREGLWRVYSTMASGKIDLIRPDSITRKRQDRRTWESVQVRRLLGDGILTIPSQTLTGIPEQESNTKRPNPSLTN